MESPEKNSMDTAREEPRNRAAEQTADGDALKKIVMSGIGAIVTGVEKSRDAIRDFMNSDLAQGLAEKGEKAVQAAVDAGSKAVHAAAEAGSKAVEQVRGVFAEPEAQKEKRREATRLADVAYLYHALSAQQRDEVQRMVGELDQIARDAEAKKEAGEEALPDDGIGKPGVTDTDFDLDAKYPPKGKKAAVNPADDPLAYASPTAPDDDLNVRRSQTNNMNEHLKQNVPPDF